MPVIACRFRDDAEKCWGPFVRCPDGWVCSGHAPKLTLGGVYAARPTRPVRAAANPHCEFLSGAEPCWGPINIFDVRAHHTDGVLTERYCCEGHAAAPRRGPYTPQPADHKPLTQEDAAWPF